MAGQIPLTIDTLVKTLRERLLASRNQSHLKYRSTKEEEDSVRFMALGQMDGIETALSILDELTDTQTTLEL